jgi:PAS domain-containing protein
LIALTGGQPASEVVVAVYRPESEPAWISVTSRPLVRPDEAAPYAVALSFVDVSERKRLEETLRACKRH